MFGMTNASKGAQSPASTQDVQNAIISANNYTDSHKGYAVNSSLAGIAWNQEVRSWEVHSGGITLPATDAGTADTQTSELRVVLKFDNQDNPTFTFSYDTSTQVLIWPDDAPTWQKGYLYEVSFSPIYKAGGKTYIVGYSKEIELP